MSALPITPLPEADRVLLIEHFVNEVRAWKSDDPDETVVLGVRDPRRDIDDLSFFKATKAQLLAGELEYIGTTTRGKDGGYQVLIFNDGTIVILLTESPKPLDAGALNDLYAITLQSQVGVEPTAGAIDIDARRQALAATNIAKAALANDTALAAVRGLAAALVSAAAQYD
jgi:hypothetical protein